MGLHRRVGHAGERFDRKHSPDRPDRSSRRAAHEGAKLCPIGALVGPLLTTSSMRCWSAAHHPSVRSSFSDVSSVRSSFSDVSSVRSSFSAVSPPPMGALLFVRCLIGALVARHLRKSCSHWVHKMVAGLSGMLIGLHGITYTHIAIFTFFTILVPARRGSSSKEELLPLGP